MTTLLNCVESGQIQGIDRTAMDRAFGALADPNDARRERIRVCITELTLHLLEDPNRIRNADFQQMAAELAGLALRVQDLHQNYGRLDQENRGLRDRVDAQRVIIDGLTRQLAQERARLRGYERTVVQAKIKELQRELDIYETVAVTFLPFSIVVGVRPYWREVRENLKNLRGEIRGWERVDRLIRDRNLMLDQAKAEVFK